MNLAGKQVVVTGAGGFIGSHLAERLVREGCRVTALLHYDARANRSNLEFVDPILTKEMDIQTGDIRDPFLMSRLIKNCDVVFHLAALIGIPYSYLAPASYVETNIQGTLNVLQASLVAGITRVIHTSTSECYGTAQYTPIDEHHPLHGQSPYAATKIGADMLAESFHRSFNLPVTTIRPFNTFGPRQSARAVIPTILSQLLSGNAELQLGALDPVRDLNYVTNTVDGFIAMANSEQTIGQVVNVGSGLGITIEKLAHLAMQVVGREVPIRCDQQRIRPTNSEVYTLLCDYSLAIQLANWRPALDLETGLRATAEFIARHIELYRSQEYSR
jgi:NAD dependent epimerase/dehydratase